jgi:hypothetical protein
MSKVLGRILMEMDFNGMAPLLKPGIGNRREIKSKLEGFHLIADQLGLLAGLAGAIAAPIFAHPYLPRVLGFFGYIAVILAGGAVAGLGTGKLLHVVLRAKWKRIRNRMLRNSQLIYVVPEFVRLWQELCATYRQPGLELDDYFDELGAWLNAWSVEWRALETYPQAQREEGRATLSTKAAQVMDEAIMKAAVRAAYAEEQRQIAQELDWRERKRMTEGM